MNQLKTNSKDVICEQRRRIFLSFLRFDNSSKIGSYLNFSTHRTQPYFYHFDSRQNQFRKLKKQFTSKWILKIAHHCQNKLFNIFNFRQINKYLLGSRNIKSEKSVISCRCSISFRIYLGLTTSFNWIKRASFWNTSNGFLRWILKTRSRFECTKWMNKIEVACSAKILGNKFTQETFKVIYTSSLCIALFLFSAFTSIFYTQK
jgi:hypothetical protein